MDLFGKKHKAGGRAAKPGTAAASRRNASRKKQDADKVEKLRASNLPRKLSSVRLASCLGISSFAT